MQFTPSNLTRAAARPQWPPMVRTRGSDAGTGARVAFWSGVALIVAGPGAARLRRLAVLGHQLGRAARAAQSVTGSLQQQWKTEGGARGCSRGTCRRATPPRWSGSRGSAGRTSCRCWRGSPTTCWPRASGTSPTSADPGRGRQLRARRAPGHARRAAAPDARAAARRRGRRRDRDGDLHLRARHRPRRPGRSRSPASGCSTRCRRTRTAAAAAQRAGPAADHADHLLGDLPHRQPDDRLRAPGQDEPRRTGSLRRMEPRPATDADLARDVDACCRLTGEFTLRSGQVASEYFDKYLFEADPALLARVVDADGRPGARGHRAARRARARRGPDRDACSARAPACRRCSCASRPRSTAPASSPRARTSPGRRVTLVEDVITTGGAVRDATRALRDGRRRGGDGGLRDRPQPGGGEPARRRRPRGPPGAHQGPAGRRPAASARARSGVAAASGVEPAMSTSGGRRGPGRRPRAPTSPVPPPLVGDRDHREARGSRGSPCRCSRRGPGTRWPRK